MHRARLLLVPVLLALTVTGCTGSNAPTPDRSAIPGLKVFTEDPRPRHTTDHVTYDHTPPAGGKHWPAEAGGVYGWLRCGIYTEAVPNEFAVHSEEHGAVWLTYLPGEDPSPLVALDQLKPDYVLVSPYPGQPGKFMASTWGAQVSADRGDAPALKAFVQTYAGGGQGGEGGADCAHGTLPAAADAALAKANPS